MQSTYLGGSVTDIITAITVHPVSGEVIVAGFTNSNDLPGTPGGAQSASGGGTDGFVSRLNANLTSLLQSTYLGGIGYEEIRTITVHPVSGEVIVAGYSDSSNLPGTPGGTPSISGGAQTTYGGGQDGFVSRLNANLTSLLQSTYLGGNGFEEIRTITVHPVSGEVIVAGSTQSTNLPGTPGGTPSISGGAQTTYGGGQDGFVSRLNADRKSVV